MDDKGKGAGGCMENDRGQWKLFEDDGSLVFGI